MDNTADKEYTIVRLSKDNLEDVARLHAAVYNVPVNIDYFTAKYNTAYTGFEDVGFIAYNTDKLPVAYYGVIPCFIQSGNTIILAAQSADTMTHPQHRYKGMFVELSNMTFDLCRKLGILLVFGFPNQNSYHGAINKLGWKMTGTMDCFIIPVKPLLVGSILKKIPFFKKIYSMYSRFILRKYAVSPAGIINSVVADGFAGVYRNEEYMLYKKYSHTKVIEIAGSRVWISDKYFLMIGDIEGVNKKNIKPVMDKLKILSRRLGLKQIQFHISPGTGLHDLFASLYPATLSYPMLFQDFGSVIPAEKIKFVFADIDIF